MMVLLLSLALQGVEAPPARQARAHLIKRGPRAWDNASIKAAAALAAVGTTRLLIHALSDDTFKR